MGKRANGEMTDNGIRLLSFCSSTELKVRGSMFHHKDIHKKTWRSPDGVTKNQIDHICISKRWTSEPTEDRTLAKTTCCLWQKSS